VLNILRPKLTHHALLQRGRRWMIIFNRYELYGQMIGVNRKWLNENVERREEQT